MAESIAASAVATQVNVSGKLSIARGGRVSVVLKEIDAPNLAYLSIAQTAGDPPATYADVLNDLGGPFMGTVMAVAAEWDAVLELYNLRIQVPIAPNVLDADRPVYACWFENGNTTPAPTDVPALVAGPFPIIE